MSMGLAKGTSVALELQIENEKSRMILRALSNAYPLTVSASNLMKLAGFGSRAPGAFISFCVARCRINSAIGRLGWRIAFAGHSPDDQQLFLERAR
jgi:hypothetical protein